MKPTSTQNLKFVIFTDFSNDPDVRNLDEQIYDFFETSKDTEIVDIQYTTCLSTTGEIITSAYILFRPLSDSEG